MSEFSNPTGKREITAEDLGFEYRLVDPMYSITSLGPGGVLGLDVINEDTGAREFYTFEGSYESEEMIRAELGQDAVLERVEHPDNSGYEGVDPICYTVPRGTKLLKDTLSSSPYSQVYMEKLGQRTQDFLGKLRELDPDSFGVTLDKLAIAHNGIDNSPDDTYLVVIPPLQPPAGQ